jgi:hypothetical protein
MPDPRVGSIAAFHLSTECELRVAIAAAMVRLIHGVLAFVAMTRARTPPVPPGNIQFEIVAIFGSSQVSRWPRPGRATCSDGSDDESQASTLAAQGMQL